jgi:hypothetical protein
MKHFQTTSFYCEPALWRLMGGFFSGVQRTPSSACPVLSWGRRTSICHIPTPTKPWEITCMHCLILLNLPNALWNGYHHVLFKVLKHSIACPVSLTWLEAHRTQPVWGWALAPSITSLVMTSVMQESIWVCTWRHLRTIVPCQTWCCTNMNGPEAAMQSKRPQEWATTSWLPSPQPPSVNDPSSHSTDMNGMSTTSVSF